MLQHLLFSKASLFLIPLFVTGGNLEFDNAYFCGVEEPVNSPCTTDANLLSCLGRAFLALLMALSRADDENVDVVWFIIAVFRVSRSTELFCSFGSFFLSVFRILLDSSTFLGSHFIPRDLPLSPLFTLLFLLCSCFSFLHFLMAFLSFLFHITFLTYPVAFLYSFFFILRLFSCWCSCFFLYLFLSRHHRQDHHSSCIHGSIAYEAWKVGIVLPFFLHYIKEVERGVYWNQIVHLSVCGHNPVTTLLGTILLRSRSNLIGTYLGSRSGTSSFMGDVAC